MDFFGIIFLIVLVVVIYRMNRRIKGLEQRVQSLTSGLFALRDERQFAGRSEVGSNETAVAHDEPVSTESADSEPSGDPVELPGDEADADGPQPWVAAARNQAQQAATEATSDGGIETALGTKWAVWVGGLALAFGGLFLVRYSIEAGLFGPAARLAMAGAFGVGLLGIGEFVRRTGFKVPVQGLDTAYVPAILTAAGAFTLFGAVYAAHGVYGFIGPGLAFTLLGLVGLATLALALLHGLPVAGLGLLGALATPMLVASQSPNAWALFVYLAVVLTAAVAVARVRTWPALAAAAQVGVALWALLYIMDTSAEGPVVLFIAAIMVAVLALVWLRDSEADTPMLPLDAPSAIVAVAGAAIALAMTHVAAPGGASYAAAIVALMLVAAAWRTRAMPLLHGAGLAAVLMTFPLALEWLDRWVIVEGSWLDAKVAAFWPAGWAMAAIFLGIGLFMARRAIAAEPVRAAFWAGWSAAVPVVITGSFWALYGDLHIDLFYAAIAVALAVILVGASEYLAREEAPPLHGGFAVSALLSGAAVATAIALHAALPPLWTTIAVGLAAAVPALATRWRSYPVLGWLSVFAFVLTSARVAYDPTLIAPFALSTTPVFNALLPGYGLPAIAFALAAWQLARTTNGRPRLAMEVAACLFAMLTLAMLVRHAMTGGNFYADELTLAEQAIYSLIALGAGGALIAIGQRSPSVVMTYGAMALGCVSTAMIATLHFGALNPLFTDESTGRIPVFNLLLLAYMLPAIAAAAVALYARGKRPRWYSAMLGLLAALLGFAYLTLSARRWYQGEFIGIWRDTTQLETYSYSALWLAFGVVVLVIGVRLHSYILRVASAALIGVAVLKVFLFDMAALEGVLRALSFIGLGAVLIGIGLFYQRLLTSNPTPRSEPIPPEPALGEQPEPR